MAIHDRIKEIRKELGKPGKPLSLTALAKMADGAVTKQALSKIVRQSEKNHESGHRALNLCAPKWGYSPDWVINGLGPKRVQPRDALEQAVEMEAWDEAAVAFARAKAAKGAQLNVTEWHRFLREAHERLTGEAPTPSVAKATPTSR